MKTPKWLMMGVLCTGGVLASLAACSGRRLPPGTPPPEYEPPIVAPWTAEGGDAGPPMTAGGAADPTNAQDAGLGAELSLDAGSR
jgi:hypothetical protein